MAFTGAAGTDNEHGYFLVDKLAGCKVGNQRPVDGRIKAKVKLLKCFMIAEVGPSQGQGQFFLGSACDFILQDESQKVGVG